MCYDQEAEVYIGSSNTSLSALTSGIERNYRFFKNDKQADYKKFSDTFNHLFYSHSQSITPEVLKAYSISWKKPAFVKFEQEYEELLVQDKDEEIIPRGAQIEALYELKRANEEGVQKGLVIAATGIGKTYLAAFVSVTFNKVLFIAHRDEILKQAYNSFKRVRPDALLGYFSGPLKETNTDICFATVQTLSRMENLQQFEAGHFDYIVIDEFHHAAAGSYKKVLNYFKPEFLLGLTATPYRMDNRDIFTLCEDNVIYEIYLKDAINRDILAPFKYFGVYDETDYSQVEYRNGSYVIDDLERQLSRNERADLVLNNYKKFGKKRTLGFCVSINHADYMAQYFSENGIPASSVHSGGNSNAYALDRKEALKAIDEGKLKVIFAVDLFNEGLDIPSIDTIMFLRPTESFVIFLQQLGRGLRKHLEKTYLTVLDFIGNYKKAHYVPALLSGENPMDPKVIAKVDSFDYEYPEDCFIQFDFKVLDLFQEMKKADPLPKRLKEEYFRLKEAMGKRPGRIDVYEGVDIPVREYLKEGWLRYLHSIGELTSQEENWIGTEAEEFLMYLEKTSMTKSYKIPTIGSLFDEQTIVPRTSLDKLGEAFMKFYVDNKLHQKDLKDKSNKDWHKWQVDKFTRLARKNPVHFLSKSKFFNFDEVNKTFYLSPELEPYLSKELGLHVTDILNYKRIDYFRKRFKGEASH